MGAAVFGDPDRPPAVVDSVPGTLDLSRAGLAGGAFMATTDPILNALTRVEERVEEIEKRLPRD